MYTLRKDIFSQILSKKFNDMVGNVCERIELFAKSKNVNINDKCVRELIREVKKDVYDTMRDINGRVEAFSKGVNINVKIIRPDSK